MMQLTLLETAEAGTTARHIACLVARWTARLGDQGHVAEAARVTALRFAAWGDATLDRHDAERVEAYFSAVLRRRILRMQDPAAARARRRLVSASIAADLREAGWDAHRAAEEARRVTGEPCGRGGPGLAR